MRAFRRPKTATIYHGVEAVGDGGGVTITYPDDPNATVTGRFVPASTDGRVSVMGVIMDADAHFYVPTDTDIRPLARSTYDEYPRDRVIIDSQKYLVVRAEKIDSFGGVIHAWLMTERE